MNSYYFIRVELADTLNNMVKGFNGRVCLEIISPKIKTEVVELDISNERGKMKAPNNYTGFLLEGDLALFGFRNIALSLGVTEFENSQSLMNFLKENNLEIFYGN